MERRDFIGTGLKALGGISLLGLIPTKNKLKESEKEPLHELKCNGLTIQTNFETQPLNSKIGKVYQYPEEEILNIKITIIFSIGDKNYISVISCPKATKTWENVTSSVLT